MAIQKQEFYEGAALHQMIRGSNGLHIVFAAPFFVVDNRFQIHVKYSTAKRSPWAFTFASDEQALMRERILAMPMVIGLVCGSDGVAALSFQQFDRIAACRTTALHVSCYRRHREHFQISGPDGTVPGKVPPSDWVRLLMTIQEETQ